MKVVVLRGPRSHSLVAPWQAPPQSWLPGLPCDAAKVYVPSSTFHEQLVKLKGVLIAGPPGDRWHCPTLSTSCGVRTSESEWCSESMHLIDQAAHGAIAIDHVASMDDPGTDGRSAGSRSDPR